ncbi:VRR-NUC domain-containing protein [Moraxella bovis]|uniref:VRR-NUC domain-containing protein n=1 Tax=Moraxella bovis TaxID=476 RepID=UPI002225E378|nr:VRR-NUC domain-containing protein [Moraxella bovis]UYZ99311.1 VRR-NUC domain-containing protein [Moraxella bovis]UYZ99697.1 VRR-NUC domain-containing protein [Moraxella bovis]UZA63833.1 VRR-NUC domain-containing protein [Moraxella bovis]UZA64227.1 VRR-NUC domain-containing protein [Moraxella bovis]
MSEDSEQKAIISWARWQPLFDLGMAGMIADYLHHSPNGGARSGREGANFKRMGTKAGFPDLFLFIPHGGYHGLFIELKAPKGKTKDGKHKQAGKVSKHQQTMIDRLNAQGYKAVVAYGATGAIDEIKAYLGINEV